MNVVYLKVLFAEPKNELSTLSSISLLHYESQKNKVFEKFLEFRQQICHWNVLIMLGYWSITLLQSIFPINLNSFYLEIEEPLTRTSKFSAVSHPLSSLKCFTWNSFELKFYFAVLMLKSSFNYILYFFVLLELYLIFVKQFVLIFMYIWVSLDC